MKKDVHTAGISGHKVGLLSDIIQTAYSDTLSTPTWQSILPMIGNLVGCDAAGAVFANVQTNRLDTRVVWNVDADFMRWYDGRFDAIQAIAHAALERGLDVWRPRDLLGKGELPIDDILDELLRDYSFRQPICMTCGSPPNISARIWLARRDSREDFAERDVQVVSLLRRHFNCALQLGRNCLEADNYRLAFEGNMYRQIICDSAGDTIKMNASFAQTSKEGRWEEKGCLARLQDSVRDMIGAGVFLRTIEVDGRNTRVMISPADSPTLGRFFVVGISFPDNLRGILVRAMREHGLTKREEQVCMMVVRGLSNQEIGRDLSITEATVKEHVTSILQKLGVCSRSGIAPKLFRY